jgi:prophage regulatory protein
MRSLEKLDVIRALRLKQVSERTGLSKTQIYRLMQRGQFPAPARLSERVVAWDEAALNNWLNERFSSVGVRHA